MMEECPGRQPASPWPWCRVLAHRGGGLLAPENTLAALDLGRAHAGGVELDVMLSADGTPYLLHDETLERTTSGRGDLAATPDAELDRLEAGAWFDARFAGEPVPRLETAARRCIELDLDVNLEIKPSAGEERKAGRIVAEHVLRLWSGSRRLLLISSFSALALEEVGRVAPSLARGLLVEQLPPDWRERCAALGAVSLHVATEALDTETVGAVHAAGLWLVCYTENDPVRARERLDWGVDCVITDRPDLLASLTGPRLARGGSFTLV